MTLGDPDNLGDLVGGLAVFFWGLVWLAFYGAARFVVSPFIRPVGEPAA